MYIAQLFSDECLYVSLAEPMDLMLLSQGKGVHDDDVEDEGFDAIKTDFGFFIAPMLEEEEEEEGEQQEAVEAEEKEEEEGMPHYDEATEGEEGGGNRRRRRLTAAQRQPWRLCGGDVDRYHQHQSFVGLTFFTDRIHRVCRFIRRVAETG